MNERLVNWAIIIVAFGLMGATLGLVVTDGPSPLRVVLLVAQAAIIATNIGMLVREWL